MAYQKTDVELVKLFAIKIGLGLDDQECLRMLVRTLRMMHACDYCIEDIVMVLAVAMCQVNALFPVLDRTGRVAPLELVSISILQIYISHAVIIDEACPLIHWQKWIFKGVADMKKLNKGVCKVLALHKYKLSVDPTVRNANFNYLTESGCLGM